jgi:hypothetical protein
VDRRHPDRWKEVGLVTELHVALDVNGERREVDVEPRDSSSS